VASVRWRRGVREAVEVIRIEERGEVGRTIAFVTPKVARNDEVVDLYCRLADHVVRYVGGERGSREHFLEYVERQLFLVAVPERAVARHRSHVFAHEGVVGGVDVVLRVRIGEKAAVQRVQDVEVQVPHVAQRDGRKRDRNGHHLDRHLLREAEKAPQHLGDLDSEDKAGCDADDGPYAATDRRPRLDDLGNSVK